MRLQVLGYLWFPFYCIMTANNYGLFYWNLEDVPFLFANDWQDESILIRSVNNAKLRKQEAHWRTRSKFKRVLTSQMTGLKRTDHNVIKDTWRLWCWEWHGDESETRLAVLPCCKKLQGREEILHIIYIKLMNYQYRKDSSEHFKSPVLPYSWWDWALGGQEGKGGLGGSFLERCMQKSSAQYSTKTDSAMGRSPANYTATQCSSNHRLTIEL